MTVHLRPLTGGNSADLEALRLAPDQYRFVGTVAEAPAEADEGAWARLDF